MRASASSSEPRSRSSATHRSRAAGACHEAHIARTARERGGQRLLVAVAHRRDDDRVGAVGELARDPPADRAGQLAQRSRGRARRRRRRGAAAGSCGSTSTSTVPSDAHLLSATTTSPSSAVVPGGPMRSRRVSPSASAAQRLADHDRLRAGTADPAEERRRPGVTSARSPRRVEAGRSTLTTVASTYGSPSAASRPARIRTSSVTRPGPPPAAPPRPCRRSPACRCCGRPRARARRPPR